MRVAIGGRRGHSRSTDEPPKPDKSKLWCSHCGKNKHTRDTCFLRVGYPEWWNERQKARAQAKFSVVGIAETRQRQIAPIQNRGGVIGGGNQQGNAPHPENNASGGGGGVGSEIRVGNFLERTGAAESPNWGGGGTITGGYSDEEDRWAWH
ncbi:uncharacterized protein LOC125208009 [Salvia hispanica]|uniref:uncharacterized protein LOC125203475 n=1 Tax=Salvia hispanica TaxID=49212 RepID=UPI0020091C1F|nr:uncharacterized protein LOC125203475 [Salvia hispanica]XP_047963506.1 uncharacterized protein LOC125208009 [Salvia hispanica]